MKTLESLLDTDFDIKTFDYDEINAKNAPGGYFTDSWPKKCAEVNSMIRDMRFIPAANKFIDAGHELIAKFKEIRDVDNQGLMKIFAAAVSLPKERIDASEIINEHEVNAIIELNKLNEILLKNKKFCKLVSGADFYVNLYTEGRPSKIGQRYAEFVWAFDEDMPLEEVDKVLTELDSCKLKLPKEFALQPSFAPDGVKNIQIYLMKKP